MVDDKKIAFNPAVELSYLSEEQQSIVLAVMEQNDCTPSHAQTIQFKKEFYNMVAGHLEVKRGVYQCVINYIDDNGKRRRQSISTGLAEKGNKKRAEEQLQAIRRGFQPPVNRAASILSELRADMLFADYLLHWLEIVKVRVKIATYSSYCMMVKKTVAPYFMNKGIRLCDLEARHIQQFYTEQLKRVKPNTVIHYHANIHSALKYAVKIDLIPVNRQHLRAP